MLIFRIEHPRTKLGPWTHLQQTAPDARRGFSKCWRRMQRDNDVKFLTPQEDFGVLRTNERYGTLRLASLFDWFAAATLWDILRKRNFHVAVYQCAPDFARCGRQQVAFDYPAARRIGSLPLPIMYHR